MRKTMYHLQRPDCIGSQPAISQCIHRDFNCLRAPESQKGSVLENKVFESVWAYQHGGPDKRNLASVIGSKTTTSHTQNNICTGQAKLASRANDSDRGTARIRNFRKKVIAVIRTHLAHHCCCKTDAARWLLASTPQHGRGFLHVTTRQPTQADPVYGFQEGRSYLGRLLGCNSSGFRV